jgi:hypothetical protein
MIILVVDFSKEDRIVENLPPGHEIVSEKMDGGRAYQLSGELLPDKIFINYKDRPSHGRQTAIAIKERKKTANIPIYFVDGEKMENEKVTYLGKCLTIKELKEIKF